MSQESTAISVGLLDGPWSLCKGRPPGSTTSRDNVRELSWDFAQLTKSGKRHTADDIPLNNTVIEGGIST